jgi:hypothetical protein
VCVCCVHEFDTRRRLSRVPGEKQSLNHVSQEYVCREEVFWISGLFEPIIENV